VFAVVEDQQEVLVVQECEDLSEYVAGGRRQLHAVSDRRLELRRLTQCRKVDEPHAVASMREFLFADGRGQPRLTGAAPSHERHQPARLEGEANSQHLLGAPDQIRMRRGQIRRRRCGDPQRGKLGGADLEHPDLVRDVTQPDEAEIATLHLSRLTNQFAHEDLAAVTRRLEAGGEIHRRSEVITSPLVGLAEMQTHPYPQPRTRPHRVRQSPLGLPRRRHAL